MSKQIGDQISAVDPSYIFWNICKKSRLLDNGFWTSMGGGPFAKLESFNLFVGPKTAIGSNFAA